MRRRGALLLLAGLGACSSSDRTPAAAYRNFWDRVQVAAGLDGIVGYPCVESQYGPFGGDRIFIGDAACYRFKPAARMRGLWVRQFEGSAFYPDGAAGAADGRQGDIWLRAPEQIDRRLAHKGRHVFEIEFIGRETLYPGAYGHMGASRNLVLVDRLLSMREVASPISQSPPQ